MNEMQDPAGTPASATPTALLLDLVHWVAERPRPYDEVMEGWRTSCPRLTVWEDALDARYVMRRRDAAGTCLVIVTDRGRRFLAEHGRGPVSREGGAIARRSGTTG